MKKIILLTLLNIFISLNVSAQKTALTTDGEKVYLYDNGTWKFAEKPPLNKYFGKWEAYDCSGVSRTIIIKKEGNNIFISTLSGWKVEFENANYINKELHFETKMWEMDQEFVTKGKFKLLDNGELKQTSSSTSSCTYKKI